MRKPTILLLVSAVLLAACVGSAAAQSNQAVDRLLDEKQATFGDAAYIILAAAQLLPDEATPDQAVQAVAEHKLLRTAPAAAAPATLGQVSFLIMETQGIRGGLFYSLFPGPRYAARELASLRLIKGITHPSRTVSGEEVMRLLEAVLEMKGAQG